MSRSEATRAARPRSGHERSRSEAEPSPGEMAAIVAAVEMAWPRPVVVAPADSERKAWRWSGRWWGPRPVPAERRRPWR